MRICFLLLYILLHFDFYSQSAGDKVFEFSKKNIGKKIERGECWDLANAALTYANAKWEAPFNFGDKIDYKNQELKPGDIIQFSGVKFVFTNGSASFPKHTAVVYKANKNQVTLLHQNFNNKKLVDTLTINFANIKNGKVEVFRPKY